MPNPTTSSNSLPNTQKNPINWRNFIDLYKNDEDIQSLLSNPLIENQIWKHYYDYRFPGLVLPDNLTEEQYKDAFFVRHEAYKNAIDANLHFDFDDKRQSSLGGDREFILKQISCEEISIDPSDDCSIFGCASEHLKDDREMVMAAVSNNNSALKYASITLRGEVDIAMAAINAKHYSGCIVQYLSEELQDNQAVVLEAVAKNGREFQYASTSLQASRAFTLTLVANSGEALRFVQEEYKADREIVLAAISQDAEALKYASDDLQNDRALILIAVNHNGRALKYASYNLKNDQEVVITAVLQNHLAFNYASNELKTNREFVLTAVTKKGGLLSFLLPNYQNDRPIVLAAIAQDVSAVCFASKEIQTDQTFISEIVYRYPAATEWIINEFKNNRDFIIAAVKKNGRVFQYAGKALRYDANIAALAAEQFPRMLRFTSHNNGESYKKMTKELNNIAMLFTSFFVSNRHLSRLGKEAQCDFTRNLLDYAVNPQLSEEVTLVNGNTLSYITPPLRTFNRETLTARVSAVLQERKGYSNCANYNILDLQSAPQKIKSDKAIVLQVIHNNGLALEHASTALKNDREVVLCAVLENGLAINHASDALKRDEEIQFRSLKSMYSQKNTPSKTQSGIFGLFAPRSPQTNQQAATVAPAPVFVKAEEQTSKRQRR